MSLEKVLRASSTILSVSEAVLGGTRISHTPLLASWRHALLGLERWNFHYGLVAVIFSFCTLLMVVLSFNLSLKGVIYLFFCYCYHYVLL